MKLQRKIYSLLVMALFSTGLHAQQPITYTQYMNNLTPFNTAHSALDSAGSVTGLVRRQWMGIEGSPTTFLFNGSIPIAGINGRAGLILGNDVVGIENQFDAHAFFAKTVRLNEVNNLTVSVNAGIRRLSANYNQLDANDPKFRESLEDTRGIAGLGIMFHSPNYYVGVSAPNMTLNNSNTNAPQNQSIYYLTGAYLFDVSPVIKLKPAVLLGLSENQKMQSDISATAYLQETFGIGVNYRNSNEIAGLLSYYFKNNIRMGYSYQFGTGQTRIGNGTQEIMLNYRFGKFKSKKQLL